MPTTGAESPGASGASQVGEVMVYCVPLWVTVPFHELVTASVAGRVKVMVHEVTVWVDLLVTV